MMSRSSQHAVILDWIDELHHPCFSVHDLDFWDHWVGNTGICNESVLRRRINELVREGRLHRTRQYNESTRPSGIPKWFFVYSGI